MLIKKITGKTQICNRNVETRRIKKFLRRRIISANCLSTDPIISVKKGIFFLLKSFQY